MTVKPRSIAVIGGGLAGMSAAIEAALLSAAAAPTASPPPLQVTVLEKTDIVGGNSAKATSGINGVGTAQQAADPTIEDSVQRFNADTQKSGVGGSCNETLTMLLAGHSKSAIEWLEQRIGKRLSRLCQLGGHSAKRTHRLPDAPDGRPVPVGFSIMRALTVLAETDEILKARIRIVRGATVTGLVAAEKGDEKRSGSDDSNNNNNNNNNKAASVVGVRYRKKQQQQPEAGDKQVEESPEDSVLQADAVILATGGFSNDHFDNSLLSEFRPDLVGVPTTNGPFATGDGVKMAREIGASLQDMDKVQLHPTGFIDPAKPSAPTKFLGPEALRGCGGILLAPGSGERFVNELGLRSHVSAAIKALKNEYPKSGGLPYAYCVLNRHAAENFGPAMLGFYRDKMMLFQTADNMTALAELIGAPSRDAVAKTFAEYADAKQKGRCDKTGKTVFPPAAFSGDDDDDAPYVIATVTPSIHYTMGGVAINDKAQVLLHTIGGDDNNNNGDAKTPIRGLFAAGEVTSGVHGANRLAGNSLLECVVFGRVAARSALDLN